MVSNSSITSKIIKRHTVRNLLFTSIIHPFNFSHPSFKQGATVRSFLCVLPETFYANRYEYVFCPPLIKLKAHRSFFLIIYVKDPLISEQSFVFPYGYIIFHVRICHNRFSQSPIGEHIGHFSFLFFLFPFLFFFWFFFFSVISTSNIVYIILHTPRYIYRINSFKWITKLKKMSFSNFDRYCQIAFHKCCTKFTSTNDTKSVLPTQCFIKYL